MRRICNPLTGLSVPFSGSLKSLVICPPNGRKNIRMLLQNSTYLEKILFWKVPLNSQPLYKEIKMTGTDNLRNSIIDKLLTISNKDYLSALYQLVEKSSIDNDIVKLSEEQILMLQLSDNDIKNEKLISQDELDKSDLEWLKDL